MKLLGLSGTYVQMLTENMPNDRQHHPIAGSHNPWSNDFDATMVWGPIDGTMGYIGFRLNLERF